MRPQTNHWAAGRWVAALFFLWSLAGLAAFVMQWTMDLAELARADPYQAEAFRNMPAWVWTAYAIAVVAAVLGALLLLLRRKGAVVFSAVELVAVIVQFGYTLGATDLVEKKGLGAAASFPLVIFLLALLQLLYARWMASKGLLA